ncbi:MAG TPA: S8 family peptidase [Gemmatimonadales bacterium]|nr:S8 family peptidase [Gemmatimonadales bacterium]
MPLDSRFVYGKTGTGVHSYHLDSGILYSHADCGGRAVLGADFVTTGGSGVDCYGHGTATALVAGGATYGVAKGLSLVGVKIVDCVGNLRNREILMAAIDWVTANAIKPAVANWSISGPYSAQFNLAFANSVASGITWVAAAGNENSSACSYSPGVVPALLTVAASTAADARWVATSDTASNFGSCVDLFAPGKDIIAPWLGGPASTSGTSLAAPHVTGAAALYLQDHPNDSPAQVASAILDAAYPYAILSPGASTTGRLLNIAFTYPNPQPLTVTITGKASIKPNQVCTWKASAQGGSGSLQYRWQFAGQDIYVSLADSITTTIPNTGTLAVKVSSLGGTETGSASKTVTVTSSGAVCTT